MLVILGDPMSPNDPIGWIEKEQRLIRALLQKNTPIFGVCLGAQQSVKALGYAVRKAPYKEVGWAPVYLQSDCISGIPDAILALHWHEEMFQLPETATLLFSSDLLVNQGYLFGNTVIGLQFHLEPKEVELREIVLNDARYTRENNALKQTAEKIIQTSVPEANKQIIARLLDFISTNKSPR